MKRCASSPSTTPAKAPPIPAPAADIFARFIGLAQRKSAKARSSQRNDTYIVPGARQSLDPYPPLCIGPLAQTRPSELTRDRKNGNAHD